MTAQRESQVTPEQYATNVQRLIKYMVERQSILNKRRAGLPGPWTSDPILRDNRFCNIYREDDRVTIWVRKNIRGPFYNHPYLWFMLAVARYINWPPTLEVMIKESWPLDDSFSCQKMTTVLEALADIAHNKVYTGAYMIRAESDPRTHWYTWTKHRYIAEVVLGKVWAERVPITAALEHAACTLEEAWGMLALNKRFTGWGPFMSYEWVTDLRHTRYLCKASDIFTWANAGPGAIRGLNRLHGRLLVTQPATEQTCREMNDLMWDLNHRLGSNFHHLFGDSYDPNGTRSPRFEMRDIEHTLCEFDKYERCRLGEGKMRSKYDWTKAQSL